MVNEVEKEIKLLQKEIKNKELVLEIEKNKNIKEILKIDKNKIFKKDKPSFFKRILKALNYG